MDLTLGFIINHVFLPPELPQKDDSGLWQNGPAHRKALTKMCYDAFKSFQSLHPPEQQARLEPIVKMLERLLVSKTEDGVLSPESVDPILASMANTGKMNTRPHLGTC